MNRHLLRSLLAAAAMSLAAGSVFASPPSETPAPTCKPEYPYEAKVQREEGVTLLAFRIDSQGKAAQIQVLNSSGSAVLDQAARNALSRCVFKLPSEDKERIERMIPVAYTWFLTDDPRDTMRKVKRAADKGDVGSRFHLSLIQSAIAISDSERQRMLDTLRSAAEAGHPHAQFELGRYYEQGLFVKTDLQEAGRWYDKAAAAGDIMAIERLKYGTLWDHKK